MNYHTDGHVPLQGEVFVFGSNLYGIHGAGAALQALNKYGAVIGRGEGRHGQSYAIPTKRDIGTVLPLEDIRKHVAKFIDYAHANPDTLFYVTRIGCGYAGYKDEQVAPMFGAAPTNCILPEPWRQYVEDVRV